MSDSFTTSAEVPVIEKRILLVEDEKVFARAVNKHLQRSGYKIFLAEDLQTARRQFNENTPELVLA